MARKPMVNFYPSQNTDDQRGLALQPAQDEHLDVSALETWLWDAACAIRGATDAPKFKDFILVTSAYLLRAIWMRCFHLVVSHGVSSFVTPQCSFKS